MRRETGEAAGDHLEIGAIARDALVIRTYLPGFIAVESRSESELPDTTLGPSFINIQGMPIRIDGNLLYGLG